MRPRKPESPRGWIRQFRMRFNEAAGRVRDAFFGPPPVHKDACAGMMSLINRCVRIAERDAIAKNLVSHYACIPVPALCSMPSAETFTPLPPRLGLSAT
jgi:hypothetical protein